MEYHHLVTVIIGFKNMQMSVCSFTVIEFIPSTGCPTYLDCIIVRFLCEIQAELRDLGYRIHAISPDKPEKVAEAVAETEFDYALYSDASAEVARAFGLAFKVDTKTYEKLQGYGIDLEAASGQEHHLLPVPAVFIIDREARIRFRYFNPDYKERLSGEKLLDAARASKL
ncbi:MAG: redoxin domain-containing protein [Opitutales bacterium]